MNIKLKEISHYKDGGTIEYKDENNNRYFQDFRIGSKTKGQWYDKYPGDKDAKILTNFIVKE